ncbi:hypothetical protein E2C01_093432 [Portunus trituberculatus]|uniref:Uncharacterized protein n=1 Tax=Portunus trituberculatus TaxID=210409 RepID=A0A5B7JPT1_PORTR|nr:hypothetical protein [Portunus trituberculatus]
MVECSVHQRCER